MFTIDNFRHPVSRSWLRPWWAPRVYLEPLHPFGILQPQSVLVLESSKEVKPARIRWIWPDCEQALWVAGHVIQPSNYQRERSTNRTTAGHGGRSDGRLQTQPPLSIFSTAHGLSHIWRLNMLRFSRLHYVQYSSNRQWGNLSWMNRQEFKFQEWTENPE